MKKDNARQQMTLEGEIVKAAIANGATFARGNLGFEVVPSSVRQFVGAAVERAARLGLLTDAELARTEFAENQRREAEHQEREALERERAALEAELTALNGGAEGT